MSKRDSEKRRRHEDALHRSAAKKKARQKSRLTSDQRRDDARKPKVVPSASEPVKFSAPYQSGQTVFGEAVSADFLVERIKKFDWRSSLVRLAHLASIVANDEAGPSCKRALILTNNALDQLTASEPRARAMLEHGRQFVKSINKPLIVAHEEALIFLEHLVLLYGSDGGKHASDGEIALWLLGAADQLAVWSEPDSRVLTQTEELAAELVNAYRFNRSSQDDERLLLRTEGIFGHPPRDGVFSNPKAWEELQQRAFRSDFISYFEEFIAPLHMLSHSWGHYNNKDNLPVLSRDSLSTAFGSSFVNHLSELTGTREELKTEILKRMRHDGLLPHAPTALLRKPFIELQSGEIVASSPWYVRNIARTGIWANFLSAAKQQLDDARGGEEWNVAFGKMLEHWCSRYASRVQAAAGRRIRVELPSHPGAPDEIEDVVTVEKGNKVTFFSVKARLVREDIARHSRSRTKLLDWYEEYFFKERTSKFRAGVVAQLNSRIEMLRKGEFEPRIARDSFVYPVLVTFDNLCAQTFLYEWLRARCKEKGLLQQNNVAPLTLAVLEDYERLIGASVYNKPIFKILEKRASPRLLDERLEVVLYKSHVPSRIPETNAKYRELTERVMRKVAARKKT